MTTTPQSSALSPQSLRAVVVRWRVAVGFVLGAAAFVLARPTLRLLAPGAAVAVLGEAVRVWAAGHLEKSRELAVSGPYARVRHPLYGGSFLIAVGVAVASARWEVAAIVTLYFGLLVRVVVADEDARLEMQFGEPYRRYAAEVPRFIPRARGWAGAAARPFRATQAWRNREHRAIIGLAVGLAVLAGKAWWIASR